MRISALLFFLVASAAGATPSIRTLWKARALEAGDKLEHPVVGEPHSPQRLEHMLDFAYLMHAAMPESVHTSYANNGDAFHLILNADGQSFDIVYLYEANGELVGTRIDSLPKGWNVLVSQPLPALNTLIEMRRARVGIKNLPKPQALLIGADGGKLVFDMVDPFNAFVLDLELGLNAASQGDNNGSSNGQPSPAMRLMSPGVNRMATGDVKSGEATDISIEERIQAALEEEEQENKHLNDAKPAKAPKDSPIKRKPGQAPSATPVAPAAPGTRPAPPPPRVP